MNTQETIDRDSIRETFLLLRKAFDHHSFKGENISEDTARFLGNITLSEEQESVAKLNSTHLLIKGIAGSGKSITLLTRMMQKMSEDFGKRFLFVSFNQELVKDAENRYKNSKYYARLTEQNHTVHFYTFHELAYHLLKSIGINVRLFRTSHSNLNWNDLNVLARMRRLLLLLDTDEFKKLPSIHTIKATNNTKFLYEEFCWMKGNGFVTLESYLNCERVGRGKLPNISIRQRETIFRLFRYYVEEQKKDFYNRMDREDYALLLLENLHRILEKYKYDHIFIDEVQDLQPMQLKVLVGINKGTLTMSGDERQRIYKNTPFSYRALGINIQSSNHNVVLKTNWRSTYQIMKLANSLKFTRTAEDSKYDDEKYFPRQGEKPVIQAFASYQKMLRSVAEKIREIYHNNPDYTFAIIHRHYNPQNEQQLKTHFGRYFQFNSYIQRLEGSGPRGNRGPKIFFMEAKTTKGLEFDVVFILDFCKYFYPHRDEIAELRVKKRISKDSPLYDADKKELEDKEKRILYVSLTRAKQEVYLYFVAKKDPETVISPFVKDFDKRDYIAKGFKKTLI